MPSHSSASSNVRRATANASTRSRPMPTRCDPCPGKRQTALPAIRPRPGGPRAPPRRRGAGGPAPVVPLEGGGSQPPLSPGGGAGLAPPGGPRPRRDPRRGTWCEHEGESPIEREGVLFEAARAGSDHLAAYRALEEEIETGAVILDIHRHALSDLEVSDAAAESLVQLLHFLDVREVLWRGLDVADGDLHDLAAEVTIARRDTPTKGSRPVHPSSSAAPSRAVIPRARSTRRRRRKRPGRRGMHADARRHSRTSTAG